jgi:hypothetical protein
VTLSLKVQDIRPFKEELGLLKNPMAKFFDLVIYIGI